MADLDAYKVLGIVGGVLTAINIITGWVTRKNDKGIDKTRSDTILKNDVDALKAFAAKVDAWVEEQRSERERLGDPGAVVKRFEEMWDWYKTIAKRVVRKAGTAQSNDRQRAVRPDRDSVPRFDLDLERDDDEDV